MIEAIEVAFYQGKILCAFSTRAECKDYEWFEIVNLEEWVNK